MEGRAALVSGCAGPPAVCWLWLAPEGGRRGAEVAGWTMGLRVSGQWALNSARGVLCPSKFIKIPFISEGALGSVTATYSFPALSPYILSFAILLFSFRLFYYF